MLQLVEFIRKIIRLLNMIGGYLQLERTCFFLFFYFQDDHPPILDDYSTNIGWLFMTFNCIFLDVRHSHCIQIFRIGKGNERTHF